jgi:phosphate acyltransferase
LESEVVEHSPEVPLRVAVDVMGGDLAPQQILQGCWDAAGLLEPQDRILLVGDRDAIARGLAEAGLSPEQARQYEIVPATQVVAMDESPVEAVRGKPDSSIAVMCRLSADGKADVVISAGNTGACVAAAQLRMRNLPGVSRPGIAVVFPTFYGPIVICDVGANITPQPRHLQQYAIMAGAYGEALCGMQNPRVGLLSIGEEDIKGTTVVKEARKLLREESQVNFIGNVEGKDLYRGVVDVVACDGFVGNIVLKLTEGMSKGMFKTLLAELEQLDPRLLQQATPVFQKLMAAHDWREYGGAPLLGIDGYCLICHGRSDRRAIMNAIRAGKQLHRSGVNQRIVERVASC